MSIAATSPRREMAQATAHPLIDALGLAALAVFTASPALLNLLGVWSADGRSFTIVFGGTLLLLGAMGLMVAVGGVGFRALGALRGPALVAVACAAVFWCGYLLVAVLRPAGGGTMRTMPVYALLWNIVPLLFVLAVHHRLDHRRLLSALVLVAAAYVWGLTGHYLARGGYYHGGRWHPGESLEAIRAARHAAIAAWICFAALLAARGRLSTPVRWLAVASLPPAALIMVVANARGPWVALGAVLLFTGPVWLRQLGVQVSRRAVLGVALVVVLAAIVGFVLWHMAGVRSDFERLVSLTADGGSAIQRVALNRQWLAIVDVDPALLVTGAGYGHGLYYPHNIVIEALVAGGVPLLLSLVGFCVAVGVRGARIAGQDPAGLCYLGLFVIGLVGAQFSGAIATEMLVWLGGMLTVLHRPIAGDVATPTGAG